MTTPDITPASERDVLAFVRHRRKSHDPRRASDRWINAYMGLFGVFYLVITIAGFVDTDLTPRPEGFRSAVAWLPVVLLAGMWSVMRFATWQGPVLFSAPELHWVLSSPLSRRALVLMRLRRALVIAGAAGAVGGVVVAVVTDVMIGRGLVSVFVVTAAGFAALALMATAASWHIERSARWSDAANRAAPLVLVMGALVALGAGFGYDSAVWWSGPWGWVTGPVVAEAGWSVPGWGVQAGLLAVAAVAAILSAVATAEDVSEEELWRRAEARSSAAAALFFGDVRTIRAVARRDGKRGQIRGRTLRLMRPPYRWLTIPARDVLALRRKPGLVGSAAVWTAGAFTAAVAAVDRPVLGVGVFVGLYAAGSRLLEPVRLEADRPDAHRMLPWPWGTVLVMHTFVPVVLLTVLGWAGLAVVGVGGFLEGTVIGPLVVVAPFAAAAIVVPAAIAAIRGPFPVEVLISGAESGPIVLLGWLVTGPVLAAIVVTIAFGSLRASFDQGIGGPTVGAASFLVMATTALAAWLGTRKPKD